MLIGLYTVPHTGTHFAMRYFDILGFYPEAIVAPDNYHHRHAGYKKHDWEEFSQLKCVVMARDPYLCAIRFLHNGQTIEDCAKCWTDFIESCNDLDHFVLNLDIEKKDRLEHLYQVADFIGRCSDKYESKIRTYADEWLPVKGTNNLMKEEYMKSGKLPAGHNWELLNEAVEWYNDQLKQISV